VAPPPRVAVQRAGADDRAPTLSRSRFAEILATPPCRSRPPI
jgi:hypothetical protein